MGGKRRSGSEQSASGLAILDATQALMISDGYAAVSVRRVAARAGVKPALVQYYFATMDDLLLAVYRRAADRSIENQRVALASPRPLHALWALSSDPGYATLAVEFMALANHRKSIRAEIATYSVRSRAMQAEALRRIVPAGDAGSAAGASLLLAGVARALVMEQALGFTDGHDDARAIMMDWLCTVEPDDPR